MPPKLNVRGTKNYHANDMEKALEDVQNEKMSIRAASKVHKVPFSTLWNILKGKSTLGARPGPSTILTKEEEMLLVNWILHLSSSGFCIDKQHLLNSVQKLVKDMKKDTPFVNGRPADKWYRCFLDRHPEIVTKIAQNLSLRRGAISEESIREWFGEVKDHLISKNLLNIDGSRVFNCDESAFLLNPKPKKVLASKEQKVAYNLITSDEKECQTVLIMGNARGDIAPPLILYNYERIPHNISEAAPEGWALGRSKNGWMTQESFYEYITGIFYKWCVDQSIQFPIVLYVDGHMSHLTMALSDFCIEHQIELVALYPNATHLLQPMDVSLFRPLKINWQKVAMQWRIENNGFSVSKTSFALLLEKALKMLDSHRILQNGFRACGLHPLNANSVDYSKILQAQGKQSIVPNIEPEEEGNVKLIEKNIGTDILDQFKAAYHSRVWSGEVKHLSLFNLWCKMKDDAEGNLKENKEAQDETVCEEGANRNNNFKKNVGVCERGAIVNNNLNENVEGVNEQSAVEYNFQGNLDLAFISQEDSVMTVDSGTIWIVNEHGTLEESSMDEFLKIMPSETLENGENVDDVLRDNTMLNKGGLCLSSKREHDLVVSPIKNNQLTTDTSDKNNAQNPTEHPIDLSMKENNNLIDMTSNDKENELYYPCIDIKATGFIVSNVNEETLSSTARLPLQDINNKLSNGRDKNDRVPSPFKRCLFWPEKKKDVPKRKKAKIPSVATSDAWRRYHKDRIEEKNKMIEEKEKRVALRLEKKKQIEEKKNEKKKLRLEKVRIKQEILEEKKNEKKKLRSEKTTETKVRTSRSKKNSN